jgi:hypothetical protein
MYHIFKMLNCGSLIDDYIKYKLFGLTKVISFSIHFATNPWVFQNTKIIDYLLFLCHPKGLAPICIKQINWQYLWGDDNDLLNGTKG